MTTAPDRPSDAAIRASITVLDHDAARKRKWVRQSAPGLIKEFDDFADRLESVARWLEAQIGEGKR